METTVERKVSAAQSITSGAEALASDVGKPDPIQHLASEIKIRCTGGADLSGEQCIESESAHTKSPVPRSFSPPRYHLITGQIFQLILSIRQITYNMAPSIVAEDRTSVPPGKESAANAALQKVLGHQLE